MQRAHAPQESNSGTLAIGEQLAALSQARACPTGGVHMRIVVGARDQAARSGRLVIEFIGEGKNPIRLRPRAPSHGADMRKGAWSSLRRFSANWRFPNSPWLPQLCNNQTANV